jgi:hypothetical protein
MKGEGIAQELTIQQKCRRVQHHTVTTRCQKGGDIPCSFQSPELQKSLVCSHSFTDEFSRASLSLRANDDGLRINQDVESKKEEDTDEPASPGSLGRPRTPPEGRFAGQSENENE